MFLTIYWIMSISRRQALATTAAGALALAAPTRRTRLAVSSYSYWHFKGPKVPIEDVIRDAAKIGFDGVEVLHRQMDNDTPAYCHKLKKMAFEEGLELVMLSIHQDFVSPDAKERKEMIDHTKHCMDLAVELGTACIRLNSGRWKTIKSFDDLMKVKGDEPPLPGYKTEDAFKWCIDSIHQCLEHAEKTGVMMALENHWGLTTNVDNLLEIWKRVNSPWLGINLDTGNFPGEPYPSFAKVAPHATIVQAKTYHGGGVWYTLDIDYTKIAAILANAGYKGYISLEMEGNEPAATAVPKCYKILRDAFGS